MMLKLVLRDASKPIEGKSGIISGNKGKQNKNEFHEVIITGPTVEWQNFFRKRKVKPRPSGVEPQPEKPRIGVTKRRVEDDGLNETIRGFGAFQGVVIVDKRRPFRRSFCRRIRIQDHEI